VLGGDWRYSALRVGLRSLLGVSNCHRKGLSVHSFSNLKLGQETKLSSCSRIPDWNVVVKRLPAEDPACDEALGKIRTWVEECTRNHKGCPQPTKTSLPKRVLQVTESTVYLRENILTEAKYACLSHCWGPRGPALRLLRNTAERLSNGVAIDKLPKTFADAARTCLGLGVHYLWIDALCKFACLARLLCSLIMNCRYPAR
jgi:hypothetical protein